MYNFIITLFIIFISYSAILKIVGNCKQNYIYAKLFVLHVRAKIHCTPSERVIVEHVGHHTFYCLIK